MVDDRSGKYSGYEPAEGEQARTLQSFNFAAAELRAEISLFWQRSLFFWGFIAASFVGYGVLIKESDKDLALVVACFGFACSVAWTLANRGSKYWQVAWEQKLKSVEKAALGEDFYSRDEKNIDQHWWGAVRYSVTRLTIAMSDLSVLIWIALGVKAFPMGQGASGSFAEIILVAGTYFYVLWMVFKGLSERSKNSN